MEIILILLLLIFIVVYSSANSSTKDALRNLQAKMDNLLRETYELREELKNLKKPGMPPAPGPLKKEEPKPQPKTEWQPAPQPVTPTPTPEPVIPTIKKELKEVPAPSYEPMHEVRETWMQKWLRNNPDMEKFIGENLVNKIGIAVLVLGIAFFVKYAIDKNWINEVGRVAIGLFCGAVLTGLAHYLRNSYRSFSSVLAGGGIAVFYFTIAFAFHQYHLVSQTAAFLIMVVITAFAIALSVLYDKLELAVIAAVGGFITPFLVSTGQGNYIVLFTYLIILNSGLLALAFFKRWSLINVVAFFFTELIFGGWLIDTLWLGGSTKISYPLALLFATVLYLLFLGMNTVYQVKNKKAFRAFDYSLLLLLNGSFFAAGMFLLERVNDGQFQGLFTLGIGIINLAFAWYFFRRKQSEKNLLYLLIGLTLTFISLTIPVQLKGHAITLFWSVEFVLLFWLYQRSRIRLFYFSSLLVSVLTIISLLMDWANAASNESAAIVLIYSNVQGLVTNIVSIVSFAVYALLLKKETEELPVVFTRKTLRQASWLMVIVISYMTAVYGVNLLFRNLSNYEIPNVYHRLITEGGVAIVLFLLYRKKTKTYSWPIVGAVNVYLLYHLFSMPLISGLRDGVLAGSYPGIHLAFHWFSVLVILFLVYQCVQVVRNTPVPYISIARLSWVMSIILLIFFSHEVQHLFVSLAYYQNNIFYLEEQYAKAGLTVVWACCSFGLMWLGMRYKNKTLRIISLSIFFLALLKLFFFDIVNISEGGKIVAFILLGILLLTISFMYQKLKKIIIDDETP
jgi:uncharacterized membrane protein